ncbi:hypothetical protein MPLA_1830060 [Mesorhizobium sp. ORS 3359]|nr:hypothetical protein MPLA_1830060 [Mesorhizobium sp. ORS 3359]
MLFSNGVRREYDSLTGLDPVFRALASLCEMLHIRPAGKMPRHAVLLAVCAACRVRTIPP